ncbi:hypothetical protein PAXRUDRAFT_164056 [Paxillus rubicundulus Ve08.2h10]|uniref:Uncharacterized protein n=1 Tax=Paxillus rubicundulus Ve08.2h10 TaxID=930991 RepID=A0A0D0C5N9_9AGAM|nr:hypothetical protein PAXRUDRAFT_164056 [Paxillus rubicundulus Ve08.2h10]
MHQSAINKATDTLNPNAMCTGTTKPVGTLYGLLNGSKEVEGERRVKWKGEAIVDQRVSGSTAPSSDNNSGNEVCHMYVMTNVISDSTPPPSYPVDWRSPPWSMPLEGENCGEQSSGHVNKTATQDITASTAAADPTTPNVKSTEPLEPVGTLHEPQNRTDSPGSQPMSMGLKGEKHRWLSIGLEGKRNRATS